MLRRPATTGATSRAPARRVALVAAVLVAASCADRRRPPQPDRAPDGPPVDLSRPRGAADIEYTVGFGDAKNHHVDVDMVIRTNGARSLELVMAVWTPGSYLVREFARHIESIEAFGAGDAPLAVRKTRKNRWTLETGGAAAVTVRYRIWAREATVRTNFVDADLAMLNGAPTFLTVDGYQGRPHDILLEMPDGWKRSVTALPRVGEKPHRFVAADYDHLVDSPIVCGNPDYRTFEAGDVEHVLATFLPGARFDGAKVAADVAEIVAEQQAMWQVIPYDRYAFLSVLLGGGGGLEHKGSTLMVSGRNAGDDEDRYRRWLGLVSHEFFHTWNGKRLRPIELGPFDYENEVYTRGLWVVEGITSYYDDLTLVRAGLMNRRQYLGALSGQIRSLQTTNGRTLQPLSRASYDAWIEYYRGDENSTNTAISYYTKGAVVAFLLDMEIRRASGDRRDLDDLMRLAYQRFSGERGYTVEDWRAAAAEVAGTDLSDFFNRYVDDTKELDYGPALAHLGLRFAAPKPVEKATGYFGVEAGGAPGRIRVSRVYAGTAAADAGINVDDELIAIDGERIVESLSAALAPYKPGASIEVLVARRGLMRTLKVRLAERPAETWTLERVPQPSAAQSGRYDRWLSPVARRGKP